MKNKKKTSDGEEASEEPKKKQPRKKAAERNNPNMLKTNNKLIGAIANKELYDSDEGIVERVNDSDIRNE